MAVLGIRLAASAWSSNEEERRKALLSYFLFGVAYILWDNIPRGSQLSCPHIEKSCTAKFYIDRKLGVSEAVATAASAIHFFTGNNIGARGDLASRSLHVRINVDRPDPENREFKHPDPIGWTENHRAEILRALYTILLGNPQLKTARDAPCKTRFKMWWRLVGSAVEYAAKLYDPNDKDGETIEIDFQNLFLRQEEEEDEDSVSLADVLSILLKQMSKKLFSAANVAEIVNQEHMPDGVTVHEFLYPTAPSGHRASPRSVGKRLHQYVDNPVKDGERTLTLRKCREAHGGSKGALAYYVEVAEN